jgi:uncharacterized protein (TIGR01777 family)
MAQRVAISGASGLIGTALSAFLAARGDDVVHLVRREERTPSEISWDPGTGRLDPARLRDVAAVVNLAGANVGARRWTDAFCHQIFASRVDSTTTLTTALVATGAPIRLVNASAVGFYGDRGEEILTESSSGGHGFLADVVRAWEAAAEPVRRAGLALAFARSGLVFSPHGGALGPLASLTRLGLAGPLGSGRQWWPWISLRDEVRALAHLVDRTDIMGPVNLAGPVALRQKDVAAELARQLHRPAAVPAPAFALRLGAGGIAEEILASRRIDPVRLRDSGFLHEHDTLAKAVSWALSQA